MMKSTTAANYITPRVLLYPPRGQHFLGTGFRYGCGPHDRNQQAGYGTNLGVAVWRQGAYAEGRVMPGLFKTEHRETLP